MFRVVEGKNGSHILDKNTGKILCVIPKRSEASICPSPPATSNYNKNKHSASHVVPETRSRINSNNSVIRNNYDDNCDRNQNQCRVIQPSSSQSSYLISSSSSVSSTLTSGTSLLLSKCGLLLNGLNGSNCSSLASLLLSPNTANSTDSVVQKNRHHHNQNERSHRNHQKHVADTILKVDLCSALGQKMLLSVPEAKFKFDMTDFYYKTEKNCSTENKSVLNAVMVDVNRPRPGKSRMTRSNNVVNGVVSASWGPRHYVHTYTFNKTQRLERRATLESGLNWKGRIKAFCCRSFKIVAPKLLNCPLCKTHIGRTRNHNCSDYRNSTRRISPSTNDCIENQMNLDPNVIFADLKDNEEFILSLTEKKRSRCSTRLNGSRLNANKTKVTINDNCRGDVAINNKSTDDMEKISNSLNNSYHNVHNNVENTVHKNHHPMSINESPSDCPSTSSSSSCDPSSPTNTLKADNKHVFDFEKQKCLSFYFTNYL